MGVPFASRYSSASVQIRTTRRAITCCPRSTFFARFSAAWVWPGPSAGSAMPATTRREPPRGSGTSPPAPVDPLDRSLVIGDEQQ